MSIGTVVDDLVVSGVFNPATASVTSAFSLETQENSGTNIDTGSAGGVTIVPDTYTLAGVVRDSEGNALGGVSVNGGAPGSRTTDGSGAFSYGALSAGTSYSLSFSTNYGFSTVSGTLTVDTNLSVTGTTTGNTVTGVVRLSNQSRTPLAGATVTDGVVSTTSASDGSFTLSGVADGNAVYAELEGYEFEETVSGSDRVVVTADGFYADAVGRSLQFGRGDRSR